jgi:hypothetical protein
MLNASRGFQILEENLLRTSGEYPGNFMVLVMDSFNKLKN